MIPPRAFSAVALAVAAVMVAACTPGHDPAEDRAQQADTTAPAPVMIGADEIALARDRTVNALLTSTEQSDATTLFLLGNVGSRYGLEDLVPLREQAIALLAEGKPLGPNTNPADPSLPAWSALMAGLVDETAPIDQTTVESIPGREYPEILATWLLATSFHCSSSAFPPSWGGDANDLLATAPRSQLQAVLALALRAQEERSCAVPGADELRTSLVQRADRSLQPGTLTVEAMYGLLTLLLLDEQPEDMDAWAAKLVAEQQPNGRWSTEDGNLDASLDIAGLWILSHTIDPEATGDLLR